MVKSTFACSHLITRVDIDSGSSTVMHWLLAIHDIDKNDAIVGVCSSFSEVLDACKRMHANTLFLRDFDVEVTYILSWLKQQNASYTKSRSFNFRGSIGYNEYSNASTSLTSDGSIIYSDVTRYYVEVYSKDEYFNFKLKILSLKHLYRSTMRQLGADFFDINVEHEYMYQIDHDMVPQDIPDDCFRYLEVCYRLGLLLYNDGRKGITLTGNAIADMHKRCPDVFKNIVKIPADLDNNFRKAYRGGYLYQNKDLRGITLYNIYCYDINSIYLDIMGRYPMPIGSPMQLNLGDLTIFASIKESICNPEGYRLIIKVNIQASINSMNIPCIGAASGAIGFNAWDATRIDGTYWVTNFDLNLIHHFYNVSSELILEAYFFNMEGGMFDNYINHWYPIKRDSKGAAREYAKLYIVAPYGRFGIKNDKATVIDDLDADSDRQWHTPDKTKLPKYKYLPYSIFITSIARWHLLQFIYDHHQVIVQSDTDSICSTEKLTDLIIGKEIGQWKESFYKEMVMTDYRQYMYIDEDGNQIKSSGMSDEQKAEYLSKYTLDDFASNFKLDTGHYTKKTLSGGDIRVMSGHYYKEV